MKDTKYLSLFGRLGQFRRLCFLALLSVLAIGAYGQGKTVSGTVVDKSGQSVIGASVVLKGTTNATITDFDGNYTLKNVPENGTITVSYVGYKTTELSVKGHSTINVTLEDDTEVLNELVVVGYGVQKKSDVTGALAHVSAEELQTRPVTNAFEAMQGKLAGVDITSSERPGTVGDIYIRGTRSLSASNAPLYVVDGVPLMSGSGIETLNSRDIESVDVLKDASATAIYGSRGANGVVIITTKQGKEGKFSLNYSTSFTFQTLVDKEKSMSASEYINYRRWAAYNSDPERYADPRNPTKASDEDLFGTIDDPTAYANIMSGWATGTWNPSAVTDYDWTGNVLRTGLIQEHTLNASGGSDKMKAFASFGYLNNKGTQVGQSYERFTGRLGVDITPVDWININASMNGSRESQDYGMSSTGARSTTGASNNIYSLAKTMYRWALPYDSDGNRIINPGGDNTLYSIEDEWNHNVSKRETYRVLASFSATLDFGKMWAPLKGLSYKINFGPDYRYYRQGDFIDGMSAYKVDQSGAEGTNWARWQTVRDFSWTLDNMIMYNNTFGKHNVGVTLLQTASKWNRETASMSAYNIPQDMYLWNAMGEVVVTDSSNGASMSTGLTERQLCSYMARVNYGFNDRYLLTASIRWDGASQLSAGHKWDTFPSVALAWRLSEEKFLKNVNWLSNLKLRVGVGVTGNAAIDPYATLGSIRKVLVPINGDNTNEYITGYTTNEPYYAKDNLVMANVDLGWEKTTQWNVGVDFGFFDNRLSGSLELYFSKTKDLLMDMVVPTITGYSSTMANIGQTSNKGVEFTLNAIPVKTKDFEWNTSLNFAWQKDKIDKLAYGKEDMVDNTWFIGESLSVYYGYDNLGLWTNSAEDQAEMAKWNANGYNFSEGMVHPKDQNGDYIMDDNDRVILGNKNPHVTGGWLNTFTYKGFELSFQLYGRFGYTILKSRALYGYGNLGEIDYWTPDNTDAEYQKPILTSLQSGTADSFYESIGYKKANFIRVRNISLGYSFPHKWIRKATLENLKIYAQVINPFDIYQSVKGYDLDNDATYFNRSYVVGLEVTF